MPSPAESTIPTTAEIYAAHRRVGGTSKSWRILARTLIGEAEALGDATGMPLLAQAQTCLARAALVDAAGVSWGGADGGAMVSWGFQAVA